MLTAYAVYAMTGSLLILVLSFSRHFPGVVPVNLVSVILFGAATWVLCRKPMRSLYSVREQGMLITICLTVIAALVLMYPLIRTIIALH
jgi:hypothetical protein